MAFGQPSLKGRALRLLAQREHSRAELARKLARHTQGLDAEEATAQIQRALDELAAQGLLSDERTAQALLTQRGARFGERRLRQDLQAKGLDGELVAQTLEQARVTELQRARAIWQRRFREPAPDRAGQARQMRFMAGRGFSGETIRQVLRLAGDTAADDADAYDADIADTADAAAGNPDSGFDDSAEDGGRGLGPSP